MRILITGSRNWDNESLVYRALRPYAGEEDVFVTMVTGGCPTGADQMAADIGREFGWNLETHPANWQKYGRRAGPIRNASMVNLGADVCLAFVRNRSRGSTGTIDMCLEMGIPTFVHRINDNEEGRGVYSKETLRVRRRRS